MFLVTGATGSLGKRIVKLLIANNQKVRAFVRLSSRYWELENLGTEIFIGDLQRERDIQKATQGIKYIISTHSSNQINTAQTLDYQANIDLIDFSKAGGVEHFVFISVLGAERGYEDAPVFKAKREVEKYLEKSSLNYTILRPSGFASNLLPLAKNFRETGLYFSIGDLRNRSSIVSTDDLAKIAINAVNIPQAKNQTFAVGGPEILSRSQIPEIFGQVFAKQPVIINPPLFLLDGLRNGIGLIDRDLQKSLGTFRTLLANEFFCKPEEIARLEAVFNMQMEPLAAFIRRYLT